MLGNAEKNPEQWRNYAVTHPIAAAHLKRGDLKKLYKIINDKQIECRDKFMPVLAIQPNESEQDFELRKQRVFNSFITTMTITAANGENTFGNNEDVLNEEVLPDDIRSIYFSTVTGPKQIIGLTPQCSIILFLDFTKPPLLDFGSVPTLPTQNGSNFEVKADDHTWFSATKAQLTAFFEERRTGFNWLHRAAAYDILLVFVGLPLSIWASFQLAKLVPIQGIPAILVDAVYIYSFFFCLSAFRIFFSYSRWVFPKVELDGQVRWSPLRHRGSWVAIALSIAAAFIYDLVKTLI